jgi:hypothetical protein
MVLPNNRHTSSAEEHLAEQYKLVAMPIKNPRAAGIDVGDSSHWVCIDHTPDKPNSVREFPAHTRGLQELSAGLKR